jgi:hypothetical protein
MANSVPDTANSVPYNIIGRYFLLVSVLPSLLLIAWIAFLSNSEAWTETPKWSKSVTFFSEISLGEALLLIALAIVIAAVLHPLQFLLVQTLEGYWGSSEPAVRIRALCVMKHRARREALIDNQEKATPALENAKEFSQIRLHTVIDETDRELEYYPRTPDLVMPTRLGNVLRRHETDAGAEYGLIGFTGHLAQVAPPEQVAYLNDQRTAVDLAVRCCLVALLGTSAAVLFLWQHGMWLLVALVPYLLAYLSYRGSIVASRHYGRALATLVDLNRFALYERLRLELPTDTQQERELTERLSRLALLHSEDENVPYAIQSSQSTPAKPLVTGSATAQGAPSPDTP